MCLGRYCYVTLHSVTNLHPCKPGDCTRHNRCNCCICCTSVPQSPDCVSLLRAVSVLHLVLYSSHTSECHCCVQGVCCTWCCSCSDLHPYHGREAGLLPGTVVGHEFTGTVEQVGSKVGSSSCAVWLVPGEKAVLCGLYWERQLQQLYQKNEQQLS